MHHHKNVFVDDKLKKHYDNYYSGLSEWRWLGALDKADNILSLCQHYPHQTILEIGAGEGAILQRLSDLEFGDALYALEISKTAIKTIHDRGISSLAECKIFDGYNIPYKDNYFDLAILSHVVEHLEHPRQMLYEASRVAKLVFVEVPLENNIRLKKDYVFDNVGHINFYSPKTIRRLVQTCDLTVLSQIVTNSSYKVYKYQSGRKSFLKYILKELTLRILPEVAPSLWTYHSALLCQKTNLTSS